MQITTNIPGPLLSQLRRKYRFDTFVETGTAGGHTTKLAAILFDEVWTVEMSQEGSAAARAWLRQYGNINFRSGSSPDFLHDLLPSLANKSVLFWLDAHWCGGDRLGPECPLLDELKEIGKFFNKKWVVLIDDARLFVNPPPPPHRTNEWPRYEQIVASVGEWSVPATCRFDGDVIVVEAKP